MEIKVKPALLQSYNRMIPADYVWVAIVIYILQSSRPDWGDQTLPADTDIDTSWKERRGWVDEL